MFLTCYDRHIPIIKELIEREPQPAPEFWLNPQIRDFYEFSRDDVKAVNYVRRDTDSFHVSPDAHKYWS